jgi:hypothetical protein
MTIMGMAPIIMWLDFFILGNRVPFIKVFTETPNLAGGPSGRKKNKSRGRNNFHGLHFY